MTLDTEKLSKAVSHALRHEPWVYELELDADGWTSVDQLLEALHKRGPTWTNVNRQSLIAMIESSHKRRHEILGDRIRALYGHSLPSRLARESTEPPDVLYHGTSLTSWERVRVGGLLPMGRQYVHLSSDIETAWTVGKRKGSSPIVLQVEAVEAYQASINFYEIDGRVWLADHIPARFIQAL